MMLCCDLNLPTLSQAQATLFCFPYAGVGASVFSSWPKQRLSSRIDIVPIQLPGREGTILEQPYSDMRLLIENLALEMHPWMQRPFAFFGHCMGALIAYDLAHKLNELYSSIPLHLFISACPAPHEHQVNEPLHRLPPEDFLNSMGQISKVTVQRPDQKVANILFPSLKADFMLYENYLYGNQGALPVNITAMRGRNDHYVLQSKMAGWQKLSTGDFTEKEFVGDHLYLHGEADNLLAYMINTLLHELTN